MTGFWIQNDRFPIPNDEFWDPNSLLFKFTLFGMPDDEFWDPDDKPKFVIIIQTTRHLHTTNSLANIKLVIARCQGAAAPYQVSAALAHCQGVAAPSQGAEVT